MIRRPKLAGLQKLYFVNTSLIMNSLRFIAINLTQSPLSALEPHVPFPWLATLAVGTSSEENANLITTPAIDPFWPRRNRFDSHTKHVFQSLTIQIKSWVDDHWLKWTVQTGYIGRSVKMDGPKGQNGMVHLNLDRLILLIVHVQFGSRAFRHDVHFEYRSFWSHRIVHFRFDTIGDSINRQYSYKWLSNF